MLRYILLALALNLPGSAFALQTTFTPTLKGNRVVCADLTAGETDVVLKMWIMGFWSGLNIAENARVGDSTEANGVVGEVRLYCSLNPSASLLNATYATYLRMKRDKK